MAGRIFEVQVQDDHLKKVSQSRRPISAVVELIWNALDADAEEVRVTLETNALGGLEALVVADDGHGVPYGDAEMTFSKLGGSWKQGAGRSQEKRRLLHGREGRGRFRAFSLGSKVEWDICYAAPEGLHRYSITMRRDAPRQVEQSEDQPAPGHRRGVTVTVTGIEAHFRSLLADDAATDLAMVFALYLRQYPTIRVFYGGTLLDPTGAMAAEPASYDLPPIHSGEHTYPVSLEIVEWRMPAQRRLYFCDMEGFPLDDVPPGVQAPGFSFSAYLKSDYFAKLLADNLIDLASLDPASTQAVNAAKAAIRDHFRRRAEAAAAGLVEEWQKAGVYPYADEPATLVELAERQVFNVVALNVNSYLPTFSASDDKTKEFQLRLLRQAVERAPGDLSKILGEVLNLPADKRQELSSLLERTTLSAIISASRLVTDRLEFLRGLETLVFDPELKEEVRERTQLHRIVAENAWMFGEQYHLSVDDQSLTEVLRKHIAAQGLSIAIDDVVKRTDGSRGIVDLMFSRDISRADTEEREHLVVELKRPSVKIDAAAITQIKSYAFAVAEDERFRDLHTRWVFWAVSSDMDAFARREVAQKDRPRGVLFQDDELRITIWVKTWAQVIAECRARLNFFAEKLSYQPDRDASLGHLKTTYEKYLGDLFNKREEQAAGGDPLMGSQLGR